MVIIDETRRGDNCQLDSCISLVNKWTNQIGKQEIKASCSDEQSYQMTLMKVGAIWREKRWTQDIIFVSIYNNRRKSNAKNSSK